MPGLLVYYSVSEHVLFPPVCYRESLDLFCVIDKSHPFLLCPSLTVEQPCYLSQVSLFLSLGGSVKVTS